MSLRLEGQQFRAKGEIEHGHLGKVGTPGIRRQKAQFIRGLRDFQRRDSAYLG
jgi:hypothetical protein